MNANQHRRSVAILQSNYIPWKGYFDIINSVDVFVFYDDVQYTRRDWRNRNQIKTPDGKQWLTVPTNGHREHLIHQVQMVDAEWQKSHWSTLRQFYGKAPYFALYKDMLEDIYLARQWTHLSALNQYVTRLIAQEILGSKTEFKDSRHYEATGTKQDRIIDLVIKSEASYYLSGPAAKDYLDENEFKKRGIGLRWQCYSGYPEYDQFFPPFEHGVTILDLLFHTGPDAAWFIWGWREDRLIP